MFQKRRQLKKEKSKSRIKIAFISLIVLVILLIVIEFLYLNFSFGRNTYLSPIAKEQRSKLISIEQQLEKSDIKFKTVRVNEDSSFEVHLVDNSVVILSSKKDVKSQISSLQLILSRLTIEGKKLKVLDFRFDNPVVSF
jgi:flagellar biosynthesis/type III secretory pathway M-ring protein FliF/YscJ